MHQHYSADIVTSGRANTAPPHRIPFPVPRDPHRCSILSGTRCNVPPQPHDLFADRPLSQLPTLMNSNLHPPTTGRVLKISALIAAGAVVVAVAVFKLTSLPSLSGAQLAAQRASGLADVATGNCIAAVGLLRPVVAADPVDLTAKEGLGRCDTALANYSAALQLLTQVASAQPTVPNQLALAAADYDSGLLASSQSALRSAIAHAALPPDFLTIAITAEGYGFYSLAFSALQHVSVGSRTYAWYDTYSKVQLGLGNSGQAVVAARAAVAYAPPSLLGSMLADLGNAYVGAAQYELAAQYYSEALATKQPLNTPVVYTELAQCYLDVGQYSAAADTARTAISITTGPQRYSLFLTEASALSDMHQWSAATSVLHELLRTPGLPQDVQVSARALLNALHAP